MTLQEMLAGKNLVVTGGTSGIGEEIVKQAAQAGARVLFSYNSNRQKADSLSQEYNLYFGSLTLGEVDSTEAFLHEVKRLAGEQGTDYFIANAGVELSAKLEDHTPDKIRETINTDLTGNLYFLQRLITQNLMTSGGQITIIGSIAADGNHDQLAYSAAKAGLRGAIESLSRYDGSVKAQKLGLKLLEPAFVRTPMTERMLRLLERRMIPPELLPEFKENHYVMDASYAAEQILQHTTDASVTGVRTIPE